MITDAQKREFYHALVQKNTEYEGIFFVGVRTTGIFCRPTCPAKKPKFENCEFFSSAKEALVASYRPCRRCHPLSHPQQLSPRIQILVDAVEANPEKRWMNSDFEKLAMDASTARRQFKKRFGMTFVEYARARRMGLAMQQIRNGEQIIQAQLGAGYESSSGFRDAFSRIMGAPPSSANTHCILKASWLDTPLGPIIAIADHEELYLLEFVDRRGLEREVERLRSRTKSAIIPGSSPPIESIQKELALYFEGNLSLFHTPIRLLGSPFQMDVWNALLKIPVGQTRSYSELSKLLGNPLAYRAVARANGANQLAILIPCHRVINANGDLAGYGGGVSRKKWLLDHEKRMVHSSELLP